MVRKWLKQLVLNTRSRKVEAITTDGSTDALDFERPSKSEMVPRLGTPDLLRLAASSKRFGYELIGVSLRDRSMLKLADDVQEEQLVEELVEALRNGQLKHAQDLLRGERGPLSIVSVRLYGERGDDVEIGRMGRYRTTSEESLDKLVRPAFRQLQLS